MKKLICFYDERTPNQCFNIMFREMYVRFKSLYGNYFEIEHLQPEVSTANTSPGSGNNFQIFNPENNRSIVLSFADRGMDILSRAFGWENYTVVQYVGGIGINMSVDNIKKQYNVDYVPFQYPLDKPDSYRWIEQSRLPYDPQSKIRKAAFFGRAHNIRRHILEIIGKHPLFELYDNNPYFGGISYFQEMSKYRISLSLNGNGEFCLRDVESLGLGIPMVRSKILTPFHNPFIPDYHFIAATEPCIDAWCNYRTYSSPKQVADLFVHTVESNIDNYDVLSTISANGLEYYHKYQNIDYMINLFFEVINVEKLV